MNFFLELQNSTARERVHLLSTPIITAALRGEVSKSLYLRFLSRAFHHVKHTPSLLMHCGARIPATQEWLRASVARYVTEESDHHEWILNDITAAGGNADAVRESAVDFDTDMMVAYAYDTVMRRNPVGFFGMVYVLEDTSVRLASRVATAVQNSLGLPSSAFTYLNSHGVLDIEHVGHLENLINRLDTTADRACVKHCAKTFFRLYGSVLDNIEDDTTA